MPPFVSSATEIIAQRQFNPLYIILDSVFLVGLCVLLLCRKQYVTLCFGLFGGVLYFLVDYGIFHLALGTRSITGGSLFWVLLWMSMSYGLTNFVLIWTWLSKSRHALEISLTIFAWWVACPMIADTFGFGSDIVIQRTTGSYHGYMAIILFASYMGLIIYNLVTKDKRNAFPLLWLIAIGVAVQFAWEAALLIGGIRSALFESFGDKLMVLAVNSLVETNLGMPLIYLIFLGVTKTVKEDFSKKERMTLIERLRENKAERYRVKPAKAAAADGGTIDNTEPNSL